MPILGRSIPNVPRLSRSGLADDPVLTTPQPIVVAVPARRRPAVVFLGRSSLVDVVVVTAATPGPLVVVPTSRPRPGVIVAVRATLADDPVLTTPGPLVVAAPARQRRGVVATMRGSLFDETTPAPLVITPRPGPRRNPPVLVFRNPAADPTPDAAAPTPIIVVAAPRRRPGGSVIVFRPALEGGTPPTPTRDLQLTVGPPELRWTAGLPAGAWRVGDPELHWTAGPPEV